MKYAFVRDHRVEFPVNLMCKLLGVSCSGFYKWSAAAIGLESLSKTKKTQAIKMVFHQHRKRYGSPRVFRELKKIGHKISKKSVETIMRANGLKAKAKRKYKNTTLSNHDRPVAPNLLERKFDETRIDAVWLSDITYLPLQGGGFVYLCVVLDLASREVLGWHVDDNMETALVSTALKNAIGTRGSIPKGIVFHSDQGSQYTSHEFVQLLWRHGFRQSMSRRGQWWDNAPMESFFASLKEEYDEELFWFSGVEDARSGLFDYIETYYNRKRMHSGIGYQIPACYES